MGKSTIPHFDGSRALAGWFFQAPFASLVRFLQSYTVASVYPEHVRHK